MTESSGVYYPRPFTAEEEEERIALGLTPAQYAVISDPARFVMMLGGRRLGKCSHELCEIWMADGTKKFVKDVRPGDEIIAVDESTLRLVRRRVVAVANNGEQDCVEVRTGRRSVIVTPNHPFMANGVSYEWAERLKKGDLVAVPKAFPYFGEQRLLDHEVDFLGLWMADGRDNYYFKKRPELIRTYEAAVSGFGCKIKPSGDNGVTWISYQEDKTHRFDRNRVRLFLESLDLWGLGSKEKFIPSCIWRAPRDQVARFLNLFITSDGSISRQPKGTWVVEFGLANEQLAKDVADLLHRFGIRGGFRHKIHSKRSSVTGEPFESWNFAISDPESVLTFCTEIGMFGQEEKVAAAKQYATDIRININAYLPIEHDDFVAGMVYAPEKKSRKAHNNRVAPDAPRDLLETLKNWRKQTPSRVSKARFEQLRPYSGGRYDHIVDADIAWEEVKEVRPAGRHRTYDLQIEDTHNFIVNGFVTHNTFLLITSAILEAQKGPMRKIGLVSPTLKMARKNIWEDLKRAIPKEHIAHKNETELRIELKYWESSIRLFTAEDNGDNIRGIGLDWVGLDEMCDIPSGAWFAAIRPALSDRKGRALLVGTPKSGTWPEDLYNYAMSGVDAQWSAHRYTSLQGGIIDESEIEEAKRQLSPTIYAQEYLASFANSTNRVYPEFSRLVHVQKDIEDRGGPLLLGSDQNVVPYVCVIGQRGYRDNLPCLEIFDEIVLYGGSTQILVEELKARWHNERSGEWSRHLTMSPDPNARNRHTSAGGKTDFMQFASAGILTLPPRKTAVRDKINTVRALLKNANGQSRLWIHPRCKHLINALEKLVYQEGTSQPQKGEWDHACDAIAYLILKHFPIREMVAGMAQMKG